jgi:hypothetical protein
MERVLGFALPSSERRRNIYSFIMVFDFNHQINYY